MTSIVWLTTGLALAGFLAGGAPQPVAQSQFSGTASFYDKDYQGKVASGAPYDPDKFTAAHRTLPFGTRLTVTDRRSHRAVTVVVNDRGPFVEGRVLDLSFAAAKALNMIDRGLIDVTASVQ